MVEMPLLVLLMFDNKPLPMKQRSNALRLMITSVSCRLMRYLQNGSLMAASMQAL
jgi:hypothetical protein